MVAKASSQVERVHQSVVAAHARTTPRYAGAVGTGFSEWVAAALRERLDSIRSERCAVAGLKAGGAVWVSPDLRAEIAYRGVTTAGELRHASFKGLTE